MPGRMGRLGWSVTALAIGLAAPAQASCWSEADMDAAKVRDLQSRLMVATLRCNAAGVDVTQAYNISSLPTARRCRASTACSLRQFRAGAGDDEAQVQYDRYATALANAYGGDATDRRVCANTARLAEEAAGAEGSVARLVALHSRVGLPPPRPGAACAGASLGEGRQPGGDRTSAERRPLVEPRPSVGDRAAAERQPLAEPRALDWLVLDD